MTSTIWIHLINLAFPRTTLVMNYAAGSWKDLKFCCKLERDNKRVDEDRPVFEANLMLTFKELQYFCPCVLILFFPAQIAGNIDYYSVIIPFHFS